MRRCTTLYDVAVIGGPISRCLGSSWSCSKTCYDSRSCGIFKDYRAMSYDVTYDIVRRRGSSHDICAIDVRWRHATSSMIVRRRKTQSRIVRHRTTVIRSSYDHRATLIYKTILASHHIIKSYVIVWLSYDYLSTVVRFTYALASHQAIIVKSYVIVRLSFDCRTISYDVIRCHTMSYDVVRCSTV